MNLITQTSGGLPSWLQKATGWIKHDIACWREGDRQDLADAFFYTG
jgi:hypothetical protein